MAEDGRPPPPYAPTSDITFGWDAGTRTYGLRFADEDEDLTDDPPTMDGQEKESTHRASSGGGEAQRPAKTPPSAFWSQLQRRRTVANKAGHEAGEDTAAQGIPFLLLPAEIRLAVYELVCPLRGFATTFMARGSCLIPPPLAQTSRKIRAEVLPFFYGSNTFQIPMSEVHREFSFRCLDLISPHVHLLREVRSVAPERRNRSWNVRFGMAIRDHGTTVTFTSQEPLTAASQRSVERIVLAGKAVHFRRTFNGQDFLTFFSMLRRGTVYFEVDRKKASQRNVEHRVDIRPQADTGDILFCGLCRR